MDNTEFIEEKYKLPKKFAIKWLKALRSGKYKQDTGYLKSPIGYCCLGVAGRICKLTDKQIDGYDWLKENINITEKDLKLVPQELQGSSLSNGLVEILSLMNDEGDSFKEIADWIEEEVEFYE
jgi:hypothetical protein